MFARTLIIYLNQMTIPANEYYHHSKDCLVNKEKQKRQKQKPINKNMEMLFYFKKI